MLANRASVRTEPCMQSASNQQTDHHINRKVDISREAAGSLCFTFFLLLEYRSRLLSSAVGQLLDEAALEQGCRCYTEGGQRRLPCATMAMGEINHLPII